MRKEKSKIIEIKNEITINKEIILEKGDKIKVLAEMTIGSKEHYDILDGFERTYHSHRLDREEKDLWKKGQVYQNGETNTLYKAYINGYALGRITYI